MLAIGIMLSITWGADANPDANPGLMLGVRHNLCYAPGQHNYWFYITFMFCLSISGISNTKGGSQTLSIRICDRYIFDAHSAALEPIQVQCVLIFFNAM